MSTASSIEWTGTTWNPLSGCTKISPGCKNCYAERMALRLKAMGQKRYRNAFDLTLHHEALDEPMRWRKPRTVFVNSMSDLFHKDVPESFILAVFVTMARARQHTFQVLTKRAERMHSTLVKWRDDGLTLREGCGAVLPNVWLGVSVEDQLRADERIPLLMSTPAAMRFLSIEPQLGPVRLCEGCPDCGPRGWSAAIHWVIVGGESGPGARPFQPRWAYDLVDQCKRARVACFVKQLGDNPVNSLGTKLPIQSSKGGDMSEWPAELRVREFPEVSR